jgi:HlyD family secretion protein
MNLRSFFLLKLLVIYDLLLSLLSCSNRQQDGFLGSSVIDGTTYLISSIIQGNLINVLKDEGDQVNNGELVAVIDTVQLVLKKKEIEAEIGEIESEIRVKKFDIHAGQNDVNGAKREFIRVDTLSKKGALPTQQRDNLKTQFDGAKFRLDASKRSLKSYADKIKGLTARIAQTDDQIRHCYLIAPSSGIISTKYHNLGEVVSPGNPVYEIMSYDTLYADFFVPQPILSSLAYGQYLKIRIDYDSGKGVVEKFIPGKITWIGNEAEFSPKNIQTRESRNELVFRVRLTIKNQQGILKRGLPVEIWR